METLTIYRWVDLIITIVTCIVVYRKMKREGKSLDDDYNLFAMFGCGTLWIAYWLFELADYYQKRKLNN